MSDISKERLMSTISSIAQGMRENGDEIQDFIYLILHESVGESQRGILIAEWKMDLHFSH